MVPFEPPMAEPLARRTVATIGYTWQEQLHRVAFGRSSANAGLNCLASPYSMLTLPLAKSRSMAQLLARSHEQ